MFLRITTMTPMAEQPEMASTARDPESETEYNLNSPGLVCENVLIRKDGSLVLTGFHSAVSAVLLLMSLVPRKVVISRRAFEDNYVEGNMRQPGMER